jgi:hypothetical protein
MPELERFARLCRVAGLWPLVPPGRTAPARPAWAGAWPKPPPTWWTTSWAPCSPSSCAPSSPGTAPASSSSAAMLSARWPRRHAPTPALGCGRGSANVSSL